MPAAAPQRNAGEAPSQAEHGLVAATHPAAPVVRQPKGPLPLVGADDPSNSVELAASALRRQIPTAA